MGSFKFAVMGMTGSNLIHSPFPALNASLAPQYEGDIVKECICKKVDSDEEKSIYKWKTSHSFDSQVALEYHGFRHRSWGRARI